jgi:hypothetical protein
MLYTLPHIKPMNLQLTDQETALPEKEMRNIVDNDRHAFSPRIRTLQGIRKRSARSRRRRL